MIPRTTAAVALALTCVGVARRARSIAAVATELRQPLLWVPLSVGSRAELAAGRRLFGTQATTPVTGVAVTRVEIPGGREALVDLSIGGHPIKKGEQGAAYQTLKRIKAETGYVFKIY